MRKLLLISFVFFSLNSSTQNLSNTFDPNCIKVDTSNIVPCDFFKFKIHLPEKWKGYFKGENPNLIAHTYSDSTKITLKAHRIWGVNGDINSHPPIDTSKSLVERTTINKMNVILEKPKETFSMSAYFHPNIKKHYWFWRISISSSKNLDTQSICDFYSILNQFIQKAN